MAPAAFDHICVCETHGQTHSRHWLVMALLKHFVPSSRMLLSLPYLALSLGLGLEQPLAKLASLALSAVACCLQLLRQRALAVGARGSVTVQMAGAQQLRGRWCPAPSAGGKSGVGLAGADWRHRKTFPRACRGLVPIRRVMAPPTSA